VGPVSPDPDGRGGSPLRIAYVLGSTAGGTGPHVAMLAQGCAARGMAVRVFGPAETGRRYFPGSGPGIEIGPGGGAGEGMGGLPAFAVAEMADLPRPARDLAAVLRLRRLLRGWAPDLVHAHGLRAGAFAALAGAGQPYRLVVTVHNAPPVTRPARVVHAALERLTARRADAVTWVSGDLAARMRRAGARDGGRAVVAAPGFAPPEAGQVAAAREDLGGADHPAVFAVGRLAEQKGFAVLIDAAGRWQDRDPCPRLAIAGEGPLAGALARQARALGVPVRFLGRRHDVPALMAAADVVVVPSLWDGQPLVVQEVLRSGRPLVASRVGGIPDLTGEDGALLVTGGDAGALAEAVLSLLNDPCSAARLRTAATERSNLLPDSGDAVDSAVALYRRVLGGATGRTAQRMPNRS
jgi:glycosyltransferase involved in cell wall biosynthesis